MLNYPSKPQTLGRKAVIRPFNKAITRVSPKWPVSNRNPRHISSPCDGCAPVFADLPKSAAWEPRWAERKLLIDKSSSRMSWMGFSGTSIPINVYLQKTFVFTRIIRQFLSKIYIFCSFNYLAHVHNLKYGKNLCHYRGTFFSQRRKYLLLFLLCFVRVQPGLSGFRKPYEFYSILLFKRMITTCLINFKVLKLTTKFSRIWTGLRLFDYLPKTNIVFFPGNKYMEKLMSKLLFYFGVLSQEYLLSRPTLLRITELASFYLSCSNPVTFFYNLDLHLMYKFLWRFTRGLPSLCCLHLLIIYINIFILRTFCN